jgi:hypothetical protein
MSGETRNRRRVRGRVLLWVLALGTALGSIGAAAATGPARTRPVRTHRNVRLVEPLGAHPRAAVGSQRRAGKTVTARTVRHSSPH